MTETQPKPPAIHAALAAAMDDVGAVAKSRTNTGQNYQFRGIDDVMQSCQLVLAKHGISIVPQVRQDSIHRTQWSSTKTYQGNTKETTTFGVSMLVDFVLSSKVDGSSVTITTLGEGFDQGDKAGYKAMAGALKYALTQGLCIPTAEAKDPEDDNHEVAPKGAPAAAPRQTAQAAPAQAQPRTPPKTLAQAFPGKAAQPAQRPAQPQARVEPTAEEIHAAMNVQVDDPRPADVGNAAPGAGEMPARCGQNQYDILLDVYGLPVQEQEFLNWQGWADEQTTTNPKAGGKLAKLTWRDCAEGSDDGMRKSTLEWTINKAIDEMQGQGKDPTRYHQRAATALWHLNQRLLVGTAPGTTAYPSQSQEDETPF